MDLYTETLLDLAKHPLNRKILSDANHTGSGVNTTCGDHVRIYLLLDLDGRILDASWEGDGCTLSIASASILTEELKDKNLEEVLKWSSKNILDFLEIPQLGPARIKCVSLCLETCQNALTLK